MTDHLCDMTANELVTGYRTGAFSPVEAATACLRRIEAVDPTINAFCLVDPETTLAQARAADARWRARSPLGPLDGVPVSIKDLLLTKGWPTRRGSLTLAADGDWSEDSPPVARLREAGAVLLGKTTTPEFAWKGVTDSPLTGITRNSWNPAYTPGGSSGGAAAAVAAGMGPLALGTDAGGSLRIPAAMCGLFTIKPTGGRVPSYPPTPYGSFAASGPISRSVTDAALMLDAISGADWRDSTALPPHHGSFAQAADHPPRRLRIGWSPDLGFASAPAPVIEAAQEALRHLEELGHIVDEVAPPFDDPTEIYEDLRTGMTVAAFAWADDEKLTLMDPRLAQHIRESRAEANLQRFLKADAARGAIGRAMGRYHSEYDILATPALATESFEVGRDGPEGKPYSRQWSPYTFPFNLTRQPAVTLPCGEDTRGLPLAIQLVGALYSEELLLRISRQYERAYPWSRALANPATGT